MQHPLLTTLFSLSFSPTEIKRMSVFKNYEAGEPTCRLYVKNIAKQVEEKVGGIPLFNLIDLGLSLYVNVHDIGYITWQEN